MRWNSTTRGSAVGACVAIVAALLAGCGGDGASDDATAAASVPSATVDRFDGAAAYDLVEEQVALGPRPAGSAQSRKLAGRLRELLPDGRFEPVAGGLRNVVGVIPGREPRRTVIVGAHYDTKDIPGFVGAVDGGSGTAVAAQLARTLRPRQLDPTVVFLMFDGEESPAGTPDSEFERRGLRGSKAAAPKYEDAAAMVLLDFVGERDLRIPYERQSNAELWAQLRGAAADIGVGQVFPNRSLEGGIADDHLPFAEQGVPSIDLIDFDFDCWHEVCDDMSQISERSLDATGEAVLELLRRL
jgi:hypothetical protein